MNGTSHLSSGVKLTAGMERWHNKVAVVTGASVGIGAAIVTDLLKNGLLVVGLARRIELMEEMKQKLPLGLQKRFAFLKCDVSQVQSVNEAFDEIIAQFGGVDILVNNAAVLYYGALVNMDVGAMQQVLNTNVMGVIHCTQRAFKSMKERTFNGHVIIFNSILGHTLPCFPAGSSAMLSIYIASKHAITAMTEMYRQEFNHFGTKIKVTSISPGVTDTDMIDGWLRDASGEKLLNVTDITAGVIHAISTPPHVQVHEMVIKPVGEFMG